MIKELVWRIKPAANVSRMCWIMCVSLLSIACIGCNSSSDSSADIEPDHQYAIRSEKIQYQKNEQPGVEKSKILFRVDSENGDIEVSDVIDISVTDSSGSTRVHTSNGVYNNRPVVYDCLGEPCTHAEAAYSHNIWIRFNTLLDADTYHVEIEMSSGQVLSADIDYLGQIPMPVVADGTMTAEMNENELTLSWTNPSNDTSWENVDDHRVAVYDESRSPVLYIIVPADTESVTIPSEVIEDAQALSVGKFENWRIQSRAYDANGMNCARGYSNRVPMP